MSFELYGFKHNPFPEEDAERIHEGAIILANINGLKNIVDNILTEFLREGGPKFIVITGDRGLGKTGILKYMVHRVKKSGGYGIRLITPPTPIELCSRIIHELIIPSKKVTEVQISRDIASDMKKLAEFMSEKIEEMNSRVVVALDQFEYAIAQALERDEHSKQPYHLKLLADFITEFSMNIKDNTLLIIGTVARAWDRLSEYRPELKSGGPRYFRIELEDYKPRTVDDIKAFIKTYLDSARKEVLTEELKEKIQEHPLYPFTNEAVEYIAKALLRTPLTPRILISTFKTLLIKAVSQGRIVDYAFALRESRTIPIDALIEYLSDWYKSLLIIEGGSE